jgi:hypothetical protein
MQQPCPHCDQPDMSLLRLVLMGEILRADETRLVLLADVMQQCGLLHLSDGPKAPRTPLASGAEVLGPPPSGDGRADAMIQALYHFTKSCFDVLIADVVRL